MLRPASVCGVPPRTAHVALILIPPWVPICIVRLQLQPWPPFDFVGAGRKDLLQHMVEARGPPPPAVVTDIIEGEEGDLTPLHLAAQHGHKEVRL